MELTVIIQSKIYEIRGQQVMIDKDLAGLYQVEVKRLNESVKRNLKSWGGTRKLPYAFTELGVSMLSSILNSELAIEVNINIMRAFVAVRRFIANPPVDRVSELQNELKELKSYIEEVFTDYNDINEDTRVQLELINRTLVELQAQKRLADRPRNPIGFIKSKQ